ncbi:MAG: isochorismatase family protein [Haloarculaceae archaeon]
MEAHTNSRMYVPDIVPAEDRSYYENADRYGNRVGWGEDPAVLVVDMTCAFTGEEPAVGDPCIEANERLVSAARDAGAPVFYAKPNPAGTYPKGYPKTTKASPSSTRGPDRTGPSRSHSEWREDLDRIEPALEPCEDEPVVTKSRASAFFDTHLSNLLRYHGIDTLVVGGMTTSCCIRATVGDSHASNFRTIVPEECVADPSHISHEVGLFDMDTKFADVTPLVEVVERLEEW